MKGMKLDPHIRIFATLAVVFYPCLGGAVRSLAQSSGKEQFQGGTIRLLEEKPTSPQEGLSTTGVMFPQRLSPDRIERLLQLAKERGQNRQAVLDLLAKQDSWALSPDLLFAWLREWPEMKDHTDLLLAMRVRAVDSAKRMLVDGADPNSKTNDGSTALVYASEHGDSEITTRLLAAGADPNLGRRGGETPLLLAAHAGNYELVKTLVGGGADVHTSRKDGFTALMAGANSGNVDVVRLLLARGADARARGPSGWSTLMFAAGSGAAEIAQLLMDKGASVHAPPAEDGSTVVIAAAIRRSPSLLRVLSKHGADVNGKRTDGRTALILAAADENEYSPGDIECLQILLEAGANPNISDNLGWTPLMYVAQYGSAQIARALLERGAELNVRNAKGQTALEIAIQAGQHDVAEVLRLAKATQ